MGESIPRQERIGWVKAIRDICEKHKIKPRNLPINKEHPGNLTPEQNSNIFTEIFYKVTNEVLPGKATLLPK